MRGNAFQRFAKNSATGAVVIRAMHPETTAANTIHAPNVVVDYQVDFVDGGVFGRIEPATAIEDALADRVQECLDRGDIIIYTMDTHPSDDYAETREGQVNPLQYSTNGHMKIKPGPATRLNLPKRNTTERSHSRTT